MRFEPEKFLMKVRNPVKPPDLEQRPRSSVDGVRRLYYELESVPNAYATLARPESKSERTRRRILDAAALSFQRRGFATLRFNFRGVGKSQGTFDNGIGELSDAADHLIAGLDRQPTGECQHTGIVQRAGRIRSILHSFDEIGGFEPSLFRLALAVLPDQGLRFH